jgi:hypothetical protein
MFRTGVPVSRSECGGGPFSGHQKPLAMAATTRIHGTTGNFRVSSDQRSVGTVGSDSVWELSNQLPARLP